MGSKLFDKGMMTYQHGYGEPYGIPIYAWYLEGKGRKILVDTGEMNPIRSADREEKSVEKFIPLKKAWTGGGWRRRISMWSFTRICTMTTAKNDYKCTNAAFYVHEKELESIHNPHPLDFRYLEDYIEDVEENGQIVPIRSDGEILPGIEVMHTPAHTPGGMTVFVNTPKGRAAITGFCVIMENFEPPIEITAMEMEVIPPGTHVNAYEAYDIMCRVKKAADILIPLHEPKFAAMETIGV